MDNGLSNLLRAIDTLLHPSASANDRTDAERLIVECTESDLCVNMAVLLFQTALNVKSATYSFFAVRMLHQWVRQQADRRSVLTGSDEQEGLVWERATNDICMLLIDGVTLHIDFMTAATLQRVAQTLGAIIISGDSETVMDRLTAVTASLSERGTGARHQAFLLDMLASVAEELNEVPLSRAHRKACEESLKESASPILLRQCCGCLRANYDGNVSVAVAALNCVRVWLQTRLLSSAEHDMSECIELMFGATDRTELLVPACGALSAVIQRPSSFTTAKNMLAERRTASADFVHYVVRLRETYERAAAVSDQDEFALNVCHAISLLVTTLAEAHLEACADLSFPATGDLLDFVLRCAAHPDVAVSSSTFDFWERFVERLAFTETGVSDDSPLQTVLLGLFTVVLKQCEAYSESIDDDGSTAFDVWRQHRSDARSLFVALHETLGDRYVLLVRDMAMDGNVTWEQVEAALFAMLCISNQLPDGPVSQECGGVVNDLLGCIAAMRAQACPARLVCTAAQYLADYAWWAAASENKEGCMACLSFIGEQLARAHNEDTNLQRRLAAHVPDIAESCAEQVREHASELLSLLVAAMEAVEACSRSKLMRACTHLCAALDADNMLAAAVTLTDMCKQTLEQHLKEALNLRPGVLSAQDQRRVGDALVGELENLGALFAWPVSARASNETRAQVSEMMLTVVDRVWKSLTPFWWTHWALAYDENVLDSLCGAFDRLFATLCSEHAAQLCPHLLDKLGSWLHADRLTCQCVRMLGAVVKHCDREQHASAALEAVSSCGTRVLRTLEQSNSIVDCDDVCVALLRLFLAFVAKFDIDDALIRTHILEACTTVGVACLQAPTYEGVCTATDALNMVLCSDHANVMALTIAQCALTACLTTAHGRHVQPLSTCLATALEALDAPLLSHLQQSIMDSSFPDGSQTASGVLTCASVLNHETSTRQRVATLLTSRVIFSNRRFFYILVKDLRLLCTGKESLDCLIAHEERLY